MKKLKYIFLLAGALSLASCESWLEVPDTDSGILAAFPKDFDGDGSPEIFAVIYDGRVHFQMLRKSGESWEITSDQEIVSASEYQEFDYSSLDERCVKE